jgi:tetratricopeptide (TPR) repeat protein
MEQGKSASQRFVAADPNDTRAGNDLMALLENEAECFEERADRVFTQEQTDRTADAVSALKVLSETRALAEHLLQIEPDNLAWRSTLGLVLIRMSRQQQALHQTEGTLELATKGVAMLKAAGKQKNGLGFELDSIATGLTIVMPARLREPRLAVEYAARMVEISHRHKPGFLLTLAHAYRAAGQSEKARTAAAEGLALLPGATPTTVPSRVRKQLEELVK